MNKLIFNPFSTLINASMLEITVDCKWSIWSGWTPCSKTCGDGVKERTRQVQTYAQNGGSECQGLTSQTQSCNDIECPRIGKYKNYQGLPLFYWLVIFAIWQDLIYELLFSVDCQWSDWSKTGRCSKSCGRGTQNFERTKLVESQNGGQSCTGSRTKIEYCNIQDCSSPGKLKILGTRVINM